jgi:DNA-binding HxlR family transcriptional regulator
MLEQRNLITRKVYPTVPPMTEYQLTKTGEKLEAVLNAMAEFGAEFEKHR